MEGDGKNLRYLHTRSSLAAQSLNHGNICMYKSCTYFKSSFLQNHYPFVSFSFHATLRLPSAPANPKALEIINKFPPQISPSILETELCNTLHHRGAKPKYQVQSHPAASIYLHVPDRFLCHGSSLSSKFFSSSIVRILVVICQLPDLFHTSPTSEH